MVKSNQVIPSEVERPRCGILGEAAEFLDSASLRAK
jgi:hypothetical protein